MLSPCRHETLTFGSGGYYIFCHACGAVWCSNPDGGGLLTYEAYRKAMSSVCQNDGRGGLRVAPGDKGTPEATD
jgi:hypothetical protein